MKTFEIEVVREYTTTFEVKVPDTATEEEVTDALYYGGDDYLLQDEIWDALSEAELEQCNTDLIKHKIKEL